MLLEMLKDHLDRGSGSLVVALQLASGLEHSKAILAGADDVGIVVLGESGKDRRHVFFPWSSIRSIAIQLASEPELIAHPVTPGTGIS
ncbi:hypothetical protein [Sphingomonas quercus]|uniref:Uncharacterized protein n=1 Tax=Sphingomonas quercus TaxID=2842451 RepID=A0ABS6BKK8_9SPHN|nr:hypothetical protein [Sphingomonas quercus]MBU3078842.1 hypothetical protein [Sphingomonas quercus]